MNTQLTLEKFDCEGEPTSVGARWERWKRALLIYLEAAGIERSEKKRASLLHFGGLALQEIFHNIPDANIPAADGVDVFAVAIKKLDEFFLPKQSKVYERHLFRLIKQEANETFDKFLIRLRQQADKCQFKDKDDQIIDQITEKCSSKELRKKILQTGDSMTLTNIINEANTLEAVSRQIEGFGGGSTSSDSINRIKSTNHKFNNQNERKWTEKSKCGRCGSTGHGSQDSKCPARERDCHKCGLKGHFRQFCRTTTRNKTNKRKHSTNEPENGNEKKFKREYPRSNTNQIDQTEDTEDIQYVFKIDDDSVIDCYVGGIKIKMLVDSGCKCNLITSRTWNFMKQNSIKALNQTHRCNKTFYSYASKTPLELLGSFNANLKIADRETKATFYVIADGTRDLLGKDTATEMGVLKVGLAVNQMDINKEFPKFKDVLVEIPIDKNVQPVSQPLRRIPIPLEEKVSKKIKELLDKDIIEEVQGSSRWVSPIVPVLKTTGDVRICVDMRRANKAILRENHPLPTMDKLLPKMKNAKYFSKLDIKDAFHQIELHPDSRHITTFITSKGLFRYKRLMFGISCAPEIFQKTLERMLLGCEGTINFIDDILVYGKNIEEHDQRLEKVIKTLEENNVVLRKDKCTFRQQKVQFLGHELSHEGVKPLDKYVSTIQEFRPPINIGELQSFLGLINYVGKWIPNLATSTEPLKELLRNKPNKTTELKTLWGTKQECAFNHLKLALSNIPTLGYYDVKDRTAVIADASPVGLGGVLVQINEHGPRIIAYGHRTLTSCERRYCQTEKEALALVWAVEHFHIFLFGKEFDLVTDHKPLEIIFGPKSKPCARIERWILRLQAYTFKVIYKPGKENIADSLSRLCKLKEISHNNSDDYIHQVVEGSRPVAVSLQEITDASKEDTEILKVRQGLYNNQWDEEVKNYKIFQNELCFYDGILLRGTRIVIPKKLRSKILIAAHEGHPGIVSMKARLRTKVWWPRYDKETENLVKCCKGCTLVSAPNPPNALKRRTLPMEPWVDTCIDLLGPLPSSDYILVIVDYFSRYKEVKICRKITSADIIQCLTEIFSRLGNPMTITADNGRQFCSEEFKKFCSERNIILYNTIPYWPQQNGEVERQNRDILKRLKISQVENKNWKEALLEYLTMYNSTPHSVTGKTPAELFFKRQYRDNIPMAEDITHKPNDSDVRDRDKEKKEAGKEYADRKRKAQECQLVPGDKVYVKNMVKDKLSLNYDPTSHTVETATGGDISVRNDITGKVSRRNIVHLKKVEGQWEVVNKENEERDTEKDLNTNENEMEILDQEN
ncbi:uncharacterized protein K02A2.6-like [Spodoptera litura]|uniref:RNA-directed DNA polymerase n=1 Tax=Spodoptera litura TaxID=69820 RepID=A0A9J7EVR6_SPOLT|nr:uncharacterized protein K02A2.6-like [Spodoptera litura]